MSQLARSDKPASPAGSMIQQGAFFGLSRLAFVLPLGMAIIALYAVLPSVLWAYNIDRASRALEQGIEWPKPRRVDSLPQVRDDEVLRRSLAHLSAGVRWRPDDAYAYRLAGRVYTARKDWFSAADEFEQASKLAPDDPLIAWESALVYEQLAQIVTSASRDNILPDLASVPIDAPEQRIDTPHCRDGGPRTCYVGLDKYTQPHAALPGGPPSTEHVLFMHPPSGVALTKTIAAHTPALVFLMALDPAARTWNSDGATYEVWLTPSGSSPRLLFQHTLDPVTAQRGWIPGMVNLAPWAGQSVRLELRTTGGPAGNTANDWFAWGNVALTEREAARAFLEIPRVRLQQAWDVAGLTFEQLVARGDAAFSNSDPQSAAAWYSRAANHNPHIPSLQFRRAVAAALTQLPLQEPSSIGQALKVEESGIRIEAEHLRSLFAIPDWGIETGDQLVETSQLGPDVGMLYWNNAAVAIIDVAEAGSYRVTVRAQHTPPAPIQLQLEHNLRPIAQFALSRADQGWEELGTDIVLQPGRQVIGVRFLNDGAVNGVDRNAVLDWLAVQRKER